MRFFNAVFFSCLLFSLSSCKTSIKVNEEKTLLKFDTIDKSSKKLYLLKNKKLEIINFNGSLTYKIENNNSTSVLQFVYEKNIDQVAYDGGYREEVVFEIPNNSANQNYTDEMLQNTKMLFGRYCNCRGKNGLFKVNQGKLLITSSKKEVRFKLQFKTNEVPQVTEEIEY